MSEDYSDHGANIERAIANIHPEAIVIKKFENGDIVCEDGKKNVINIDVNSLAIQNENDRLDALADSFEWQKRRLAEYPNMEELTVALYDTEDKAVIQTKRAAVKSKWPKDNSGPVE